MKYTITQFNKEFPDDEACLERMFQQRFGDLKYCPKCGAETSFYKIAARKCYSCKHCGNHIYPLAGTIFHKSPTPLKLWFYAIFLFTASKNGVSAKELQRQLGVTYKTAWRMAKQIRELFGRIDTGGMDGTIEMDETFIGGRTSLDKKYDNKMPVVGAIERKGKLTAKVTQDASATTLQRFMIENIKVGASIYTDDWKGYHRTQRLGYIHRTVVHSKEEWVNGSIHTNTIEGFWSQMKRSIKGTYHYVSPKYLQTYVDEFAWRYNHRDSEEPIFLALLARI